MSLLKEATQKKLLKRWGAILESGKKIQDENVKLNLAQLLENTRQYFVSKGLLTEAAPGNPKAGVRHNSILGTDRVTKGASKGFMGGPYSYDQGSADIAKGNADYYIPNVVLPILRRIMPDLIANELVAVQPMNGPVGYALAYRPLYGENGDIKNGDLNHQREIGYAPTDTRWTGTAASSGDSSFMTAKAGDSSDITNEACWNAYAGSEGGAAMWQGTGVDLADAEYAQLGQNYPTVTFGLIKSAVEAKTRKLAAHWSPELAEDMQAMHGLDVEKEMINTLTYEVGAEIDRQIVTEMVKAALVGGSKTIWDPSKADGLDQMGRLATLLTQITIEANQIAIRTRRGNANFVVTTPRVTALLQQLSMNKFTSFKTSAAIPSVPDTGVGALSKVGLLNDDSMLLVRDSYAAQGTSDYVLMGYRGKTAGDSGIIYCPYIPLQLQKIIQPGTFTPSVGARTRYGIMSNPWDAKNYYSFMRITGLTSAYQWGSERHFIATPSTVSFDNQTDNNSKQYGTTFPQV